MRNVFHQCIVWKRLLQLTALPLLLTLTIVTLSPAEPGTAQQLLDRPVTLQLNEQELRTALTKLEHATQTRFVYKSSLVRAQVVSLTARSERLASVLDRLLKPLGIDYEVTNDYIVLSRANLMPKPNSPLDSPRPTNEPAVERRQPLDRNVAGRVTSETGEGLPGVSVVIKSPAAGSGMRGTTTDGEGNFRLSVPNGAVTLVFSFVGYASQEVAVSESQATVSVQLVPDNKSLSEVVVVGYGTQQRRDVTSSIASISTRDIKDQPVPNVVEGLTGRIPGVLVQQNTGAPGNSPSIKIRGLGSISAGNGPLVVIDGQPVNSGDLTNGGGLNLLNPSDIDKIDILKDASATAIYGSRGANGVIVVTTKRGKAGQMRLNVDYFTGVQEVTKRMDVLNAQQYAEFSKEGANNAYLERVPGAKIEDANSARPTGQRYQYPRGEFAGVNFDNPGALTSYDYQDMIFRKAPISSYQVTGSGGTDKVQFMLSGNYLKQDGIIKRSGIDRYTFRSNIDAQLNPALRMGLSFSPSFTVEDRVNTDGHWASNGIINAALNLPPFIPIYQADGLTYNSQGFYAAPYNWPSITNPVANITEVDNQIRTTRLLGNAYVELTLLKNLNYRGTIGGDIIQARQNYYQTSALPLNQLLPPTPNSAFAENSQNINWVTNHTLTYNRQIGDKHRLEGLIGLEAQKNDFERTRIDANNFPNDLVRTVNAGTILGTNASRNLRDQWSLASYFARVAYSLADKYLFNASIRRDGSSRFGQNNRWGTFPSASVGWRVSEEAFLRNNAVVSELKLKLSYGLAGNNAFTSNYPALGLLGNDNYVLGNALANGLAVNTISNPNLTWERSRQFDAGLELGLLNNRLFLTADYYRRVTTDLLLAVQVPTLTGFSSAVRNIGQVENKGVELALNTRNLTGVITWTTDLNISFNRNKVLALGPTGDPIRSGTGVGETNITLIGQPLGNLFGYRQIGVFRDQADVDNSPRFADARPGDVKYADVNSDGKIDANDRTSIGNNQPDFIYGVTNTFSFKGIDLGIVVQGVQGGEILNLSRRFYENLEGNSNQLTTVLNRWQSAQQPGNGVVPRANARTTGNNNAVSTRWVEDASYFRIRNITVGYNLPKTVVNRARMQSLRVYAGIQNALTLSNYLSYNPEVSGYEGPLTGGVDYGSYPIARTYTLGINIGL